MSDAEGLIEQAFDLTQAGENTAAFALLEAAANSGDSKAKYLAALMLESGIGTLQDVDRARELYFSSAELGYSEAQAQNGGFYAFCNGVDVALSFIAAFSHQRAAF